MIPDFDVTRVGDGSLSVVIGRRYTGKTRLVLDLVARRGLPYGVAASATEHRNDEYSRVMPAALVLKGEYEPGFVQRFVERQKVACRTASPDPRGFIVLDDCMYDATWTKSTDIRELFLNGRALRSTVVITMSYAQSMPPLLRGNVDFVFVFRDSVNLKRVWEQYGGHATLEAFESDHRECTADPWSCMVLDMAARGDQAVFKYAAPAERVTSLLCSTNRSRM